MPYVGLSGHLPQPAAGPISSAMHVTIKTPEEQEKMRVAGRLAAEVLDIIGEHVVPGVTTEELDRICHDHIVKVQRAVPANLNYRGFPKSICTSPWISFAAASTRAANLRSCSSFPTSSHILISLMPASAM